MDRQSLALEEGDKKVIIETTVESLVEEFLCKYEEVCNNTSSYMDVEALTLEEEAKNSNSYKNIDAVSTQYANKAISENVEALHNEYDLQVCNQ